jgi:hypothetical protein
MLTGAMPQANGGLRKKLDEIEHPDDAHGVFSPDVGKVKAQ